MAKKKPQEQLNKTEPAFDESEIQKAKAADQALKQEAAIEKEHKSSSEKTDLEQHPKFAKFKR